MINFTKYAKTFSRRTHNLYTIDMFQREYGNLPQGDQNYAELAGLIDIYKDIQPQNVLEIGSQIGGSLRCWSIFKSPSAKIISIDISDECHTICKNTVNDPEIIYITGASEDPKTFEKVKNVCPSIQFLFIDALHSFDTVKSDYTWYSSLVSSGGIIAFHDISQLANCPVGAFWDSLKNTNTNYIEFINTNLDPYIKRTGQGWGIGVIEVV